MPGSENAAAAHGPLQRLLALPNEHPLKTIIVALVLCLVCSVLVSTAAVLLKPRHLANEALLAKQREILRAVGRYHEESDISAEFRNIDSRLVELSTGNYVARLDEERFDYAAARADPATRVEIAPEQDIAKVHAISSIAPVYLVRERGSIHRIILPVYGYGLWSTMYAYLALEADGNQIAGISIYRHGETPGLTSALTNPAWLGNWRGKNIYDDQGKVRLTVIKPGEKVPSEAAYQIDGISGATLTCDGVTRMIRFWLGDQGYGPYLRRHFHRGSGS